MKRKARPAIDATAHKRDAPSKARRFPTRLVLAALGLAAAVLIISRLIPSPPADGQRIAAQSTRLADGSIWTVGMLRPDGLRIAVSGRDDASQVLDPQRFSSPEVRHGYWVARQIPQVLNKLYCWCGCENRGEHRSNLQCFEDEMAQNCPVCLGTAEIAYDMTSKGITDAAKIQAAVDVHWGPGR
jgi:hypothetical protein